LFPDKYLCTSIFFKSALWTSHVFRSNCAYSGFNYRFAEALKDTVLLQKLIEYKNLFKNQPIASSNCVGWEVCFSILKMDYSGNFFSSRSTKIIHS
jgi:hypothetical protein